MDNSDWQEQVTLRLELRSILCGCRKGCSYRTSGINTFIFPLATILSHPKPSNIAELYSTLDCVYYQLLCPTFVRNIMLHKT